VIPNDGTPPELYLDSHWFVFGTRARAEKQVERMIRHAGIEVFLPLVERESRWADRVKRIGFPLFPSYVFVHFRLAELNDVLPLPGVTGVLTPNGYPTPVREEEMDSLRRLVHGSSVSGVVPAPTPTDLLRPGSEVRVVSGPFEGMRGCCSKTAAGRGWRCTSRRSGRRRASSCPARPWLPWVRS
jgi:transcription antitermination factor NusG